MDYTYAGTKARTLETDLLTDNQIEMLLGARSIDEFYSTLEDTFLASHLAEYRDANLSSILEAAIRNAKQELVAMSPEPELLDVLWLKYDFYNLKTVIKGGLAEMHNESVQDMCFDIGTVAPRRLITAYHENNLAGVDARLEEARREAATYSTIAEIDLVMNLQYLTSIGRIANELESPFLSAYVVRLIDMFNIKSTLRLRAMSDLRVRDVFVAGGSIYRSSLEAVDSTLETLGRLGEPDHWKDAIREYQETGDFALLEKAADDHMNNWLKWQSYEIFSPAPLIAYFTAKKNNVQMIRAIYVGKLTGLEESEIRRTLRNAYQ